MYTIKNATISDIPLIRELCMQIWPQTYTPILGPEQVNYMIGLFYSPDALKRQMDENGHNFIIGYLDSIPVAFASYSEEEPGIFKLHKLYIHPGTQGKGMGRFMLDHIVTALKSKKGMSLRLNVNRFNTSAMAFYKKMGFHHLEDEDIDIGEGYFMNDHMLELPL
jgi:diamine N-acetyltransferase